MDERGIRVAVVDDSTFVRRAVERMLSDTVGLQVIATGSNGHEAVEIARTLRPDVIVMDVNMPEMNGLDALEIIMREAPTPVLLLSSVTREGADVTLRALELGAVDFIDKSITGSAINIHDLQALLRDKIRAVAGALPPAAAATRAAPPRLRPARTGVGDGHGFAVVSIGASTGGPRALAEILPALPATLPAAVVVAQHMPAGFTTTMAERLDQQCALRVAEARDGDWLEPGAALIAPGGQHTSVEREGGIWVARVREAPDDAVYRPSVDLLLHSVAEAAGRQAVGVVLTGMGSDGAAGLRALREAGGRTLVESEESAVIYGMPGAALPAAERALPLPRIASAIETLVASIVGARQVVQP